MTEQATATPEEQALAEQAMSDAMNFGYSGDKPEAPEGTGDDATDPAPAAATTATTTPEPATPATKPAPPADDDLMAKVTNLIDGRLRNHSGHVNKLLDDKLKAFTPQTVAAASAAVKADGGDAPTQAQVTAALSSGTKMKELREEFPEFAAALDEQAASLEQAILSKLPKSDGVDPSKYVPVEQFNSVKDLVFDMAVDRVHPGWTDKLNTPQFAAWLSQQPEDVQALGTSDNPSDGIKFMGLFAEHEKTLGTAQPRGSATQSNKIRLQESAVPVKTGGKPPTKTMSAEEAMNYGYKSVG